MIVNDLKMQHIQILEKLEALAAANACDSGLLEGAKELLMAHTQMEDQHLYPKLKEAAKTDRALANTLDVFARNMDEIAGQVQAVLTRCQNDPAALKELGGVVSALRQRIWKEENILFARFTELG